MFTFLHAVLTMPLIGQNLHNYLTHARSREVIGHATIRLPMPHFLLVLHCDQASISNGYRDIRPQTLFALIHRLNRHCAWVIYHVTYARMQNLVHILVSHLRIAFSLWHFYWAPMKNKGCLLLIPLTLNAKSSEHFPSPDQNLANFGGFGSLWGKGYKKYRILLQKAHPCVNPRRFRHFASKSAGECDPQMWAGKKSESVRLLYERHVAVNTGLELPFSLW